MKSSVASVGLLLAFFACTRLSADGPADNVADKVRRMPPPGIAIGDAARSELQQGTADLAHVIDELRGSVKPAALQLLPDVEIFHKAVDWALRYDEFYKSNEIDVARALLRQGSERAAQLRGGQTPWLSATGLVVRGYRSKIDGSIQPYGLVVPISFQRGGQPKRLDFWFHGRGEQLTELAFLNERQKSPGEFTPANAFVLHPYGRYCNGQRFAGEVDAFEALEHVRKNYPIDENRIAVRGFSLGGAACWHMAVHHAGLWGAAAPGAGFSETSDFLKVFQNELLKPTWYEQKLWHMYDATDHALNLFNCPVIAYSGEIDRQKQAADKMAEAMSAEGLKLVHVIGPKTAHAYHRDAKEEINRRVDSVVAAGRNPLPARVRFVTWTLRYSEMSWVRVEGLEHHWERGSVDAELGGPNTVKVSATNITMLTLSMPPGLCPFDPLQRVKVFLNGQAVDSPPPWSDRSWRAQFRNVQHDNRRQWLLAEAPGEENALRKRPGLQGPVDDAFMDSFLFVSPTGKGGYAKVDQWVQGEMSHAIEHWHRQFRGDVRARKDRDVTEEDIASHNLILWGDASSNLLLAKMADRLPVRWKGEEIEFGKKTFAADHHAPVLIYPNPLNPKRYVVLNSGFTFREYDYLNNARQTSKLPDYAIVDLDTPPSTRWPGKIVEAGFFGEQWELP